MPNDVRKEPEKNRRTVLKTAAQVAITAPAVTMLLAASTKNASAQTHYGNGIRLDATTDANLDGLDALPPP